MTESTTIHDDVIEPETTVPQPPPLPAKRLFVVRLKSSVIQGGWEVAIEAHSCVPSDGAIKFYDYVIEKMPTGQSNPSFTYQYAEYLRRVFVMAPGIEVEEIVTTAVASSVVN